MTSLTSGQKLKTTGLHGGTRLPDTPRFRASRVIRNTANSVERHWFGGLISPPSCERTGGGLQRKRNGLQPRSDGFQPTDGLQPKSNGLQPNSIYIIAIASNLFADLEVANLCTTLPDSVSPQGRPSQQDCLSRPTSHPCVSKQLRVQGDCPLFASLCVSHELSEVMALQSCQDPPKRQELRRAT